jgi:Tol biopolymer transport system component
VEKASNPSWSPDGARVAVDAAWAGPRRLWVFDSLGRNPQQVTTDVSEEVDHLRPRWSPDGKRLVFQNVERTKFDVRVVDLATKTMLWVTNDPARDIEPSWSISGAYIYFSSDRGGGLNLWRVPVTFDGKPSGSLQQLTTGAGQDLELALSRDGSRLAFSILRQNADIWRIPVAPQTGMPSGKPEELIATTREDSRGAWSPDSESIAFNSDRAGDMNIWLFSVSTRQTRQLTHGPGGDFQPNWSPDGRRIAFFTSRSGNADIWTVDVASGELRRLTRSDSIDVNPFFSPDGGKIAYQSDQGGRMEVWVMDADGSNARQLTKVGVGGHFLRWKRDGRGIVFRCPCGGEPKTMEVAMAGGDPAPFAVVAGGSHMSFSPDSASIMDAVGHKSLWVSPLTGGAPAKVFEFGEPDVRIDYPVWSPDGRWVLVDRFRPQGGDIWFMEGFE